MYMRFTQKINNIKSLGKTYSGEKNVVMSFKKQVMTKCHGHRRNTRSKNLKLDDLITKILTYEIHL